MQPFVPDRLVPEIWLMTDERNDHTLEDNVSKLPRRSGIIYRHYHLDSKAREARFAQLRKIARRRDHTILLAGSPHMARAWGADGIHGREWKKYRTSGLLHSAPVHDAKEIAEAKHADADLFFLSPAFATQSHPGKKPLSTLQLRQLIRLCDKPVILLGGMNAKRFNSCRRLGASGWAAIDALRR